MAYYSSSYYQDDHREYRGEYSLTPYFSCYDSAPVQDSVADSNYNYDEHQFYADYSAPYFAAYDPAPRVAHSEHQFYTDYSAPFLAAYDPASSCSRITYSAYTFSKPMYVEYDPSPYYSAQTEFMVSYSAKEFNVPEFEEYDPTPYGGGYDPTATYGKPLPPSDDICYPRSTLDTNAASLDGMSHELIAVKDGKGEIDEPAAKPPSEKKPTSASDADQKLQEHVNGHDKSQEKTLDVYQGEESNEKHGDDRLPQSGYEGGYGNGSNGEEYGHGYGKAMPQIPSGYGLEAMDLCESLFGYWPCLSRIGRRGVDCHCQEAADYGSCGNQWKESADYLFGSPNPYGERGGDGGSYGSAIYGYQRHYQDQPLYQQVED